ncbi:hypothetical protein GUJ93_ZPchr0001g31253 [Zizania palustris]|uniref:Uncharacterized protein n=1 Tax=Zizania palustris TaxID=103762 RepID=A0A8J5VMT2_ZIZPA|nr:hypothetical protein GUJ93_ZPchr0001g31253 [Zizania palustris]KAG8053854.1 hypothetical protein GUJ93_ZPchr0001g31253 [Zizania palustris]
MVIGGGGPPCRCQTGVHGLGVRSIKSIYGHTAFTTQDTGCTTLAQRFTTQAHTLAHGFTTQAHRVHHVGRLVSSSSESPGERAGEGRRGTPQNPRRENPWRPSPARRRARPAAPSYDSLAVDASPLHDARGGAPASSRTVSPGRHARGDWFK